MLTISLASVYPGALFYFTVGESRHRPFAPQGLLPSAEDPVHQPKIAKVVATPSRPATHLLGR